MRDILILLLLTMGVLTFSGCGEDDEGITSSSSTQGWHFQGRDCLACHNQDLKEDKHLLFAGTVYKDKDVINQDDENNSCGGELLVNFLDKDFNAVYSSKDYKAEGSTGYNGKGNIFILQRELRLLSADTYSIQITSADGVILAASNFSHKFSSADYDANTNVDFNNRISCNACHIKGGSTSPLYVQVNSNLCK